MLNRIIMFSSLSLILSSLPHSAYSMEGPDDLIQSGISQKRESIDKYPNSVENIVRYATRAMGSLLNRLDYQDKEFVNFHNNVTSIICQTLESPVTFYIHRSVHDDFLRMEDISLEIDGSTPLKETDCTFMDLEKALLKMDISFETKKEKGLPDDKVYITIQKLNL